MWPPGSVERTWFLCANEFNLSDGLDFDFFHALFSSLYFCTLVMFFCDLSHSDSLALHFVLRFGSVCSEPHGTIQATVTRGQAGVLEPRPRL